MLKNWCFWTAVLEKTFESPLDCKEIHPVHPKGNQFWVFIRRTDAEAETPILWPPDGKNWLIEKNPDAGKDWRWEEEGTAENEMVGWHHWLNGHEFVSTLGVGDGQGGLACCSPWVTKNWSRLSDWTDWLIWDCHLPDSSVGFSRQEYWSGLPFPSLDIPNPGIELASVVSPALTDGVFTSYATWEAHITCEPLLNTHLPPSPCINS